MPKLLIRYNQSGEIITWGEEFPDGLEIPAADIPSDWDAFGSSKYKYDGTALVVREGWVDPVPDPIVEPEA